MSEIERLSDEQAADLAALEMAAAADLAGPNVGSENADPAPSVNLADEIAGMLMAAVSVLAPVLPSLGKIYTEQTTGAVGGALAAVCVKRGWLAGGLMGEWSEEIACGVVVLPLAVATYQGIKADIAKIKDAKPKEPAKVAAPTGAGVVSMPEQPAGQGVTIGQPIKA